MTLNRLIAFSGSLGPPFTSVAQSNSPITRERVCVELIQLKMLGYNHNPTGEQTQYPRDVQKALVRLHAQDRWPRVRRDR
jgi:hypothetical protein